jgi:hypothetical protein
VRAELREERGEGRKRRREEEKKKRKLAGLGVQS